MLGKCPLKKHATHKHINTQNILRLIVDALVKLRRRAPVTLHRPHGRIEAAARRHARAERRLAIVLRVPVAFAGHRQRGSAPAAKRHANVAGAALAVAARKAATLHQRHVRVRPGIRAERDVRTAAGNYVQLADVQRLAAHRLVRGGVHFAIAQVAGSCLVHFVRLLHGDLVGDARCGGIGALAQNACDDHCVVQRVAWRGVECGTELCSERAVL